MRRKSWSLFHPSWALSCLLLGSCGSSSSVSLSSVVQGVCIELDWEWCQPEPEPPELNDVILHGGNPAATPDHAGATFDRVLGRMQQRPASTLRLWAVRPSGEATRLLLEVQSPLVTSPTSERRRRHERIAWTSSARERLMSVTSVALAEPQTAGSPARALAEVALATVSGGPPNRNLIVVSDGTDAEVTDALCRSVSVEDDWMDALPWHRFTRPGLFAESRLYFVYFGPEAYPCAATTLRYSVLTGMWFNFARGAREAVIRRGPLVFTDSPFSLAMSDSVHWL